MVEVGRVAPEANAAATVADREAKWVVMVTVHHHPE
jgi:hypothetical protein